MDDLNDRTPETPTESPEIPADLPVGDRTRRDFLQGSARRLAYASPLVLLFHPTAACASNGSQLTQVNP